MEEQQKLQPQEKSQLPSFHAIARKIEEDQAQAEEQALPHLQKYNTNRKEFDAQGNSHLASCLLQALCFQVESFFPPLREDRLILSLSLFNNVSLALIQPMQLMMFREFEIVLWYSFCSNETLQDAISGEEDQIAQDKKAIINHLSHTAFYTKRVVSTEEDFRQYQAYFDQNFAVFQGKHTDWLLLNEPDSTVITPQKVNELFCTLMDVYAAQVMHDCGPSARAVVDFNEIAQTLLVESELMEASALVKQQERQQAKAVKLEKQQTKKRYRKALQKEAQTINEQMIKPVDPVTAFQQDPSSKNFLLLQQYQQTPQTKKEVFNTPSKKQQANINDSFYQNNRMSQFFALQGIMQNINQEPGENVNQSSITNTVPQIAQVPFMENNAIQFLQSQASNPPFKSSSILNLYGSHQQPQQAQNQLNNQNSQLQMFTQSFVPQTQLSVQNSFLLGGNQPKQDQINNQLNGNNSMLQHNLFGQPTHQHSLFRGPIGQRQSFFRTQSNLNIGSAQVQELLRGYGGNDQQANLNASLFLNKGGPNDALQPGLSKFFAGVQNTTNADKSPNAKLELRKNSLFGFAKDNVRRQSSILSLQRKLTEELNQKEKLSSPKFDESEGQDKQSPKSDKK